MNKKTTIISNDENWMEYTAVRQLDALANLEGSVQVVGLPDLHAGKSPVGLALITEEIIYPHIIGNDIGCGMSLYSTDMEKRKLKLDRWIAQLEKIRNFSDIQTVNQYNEPCSIKNMGTIGSGNHFAEFQMVNSITDRQEFAALKLDENMIYLLIHSGSRGYGQNILSRFRGIGYSGAAARDYMEKHNYALEWAKANRDVVADKLIRYLGYTPTMEKIIDCCHNFLEERDGLFIHRKGAVSTEAGPVVIPGSRGSLTYIVKPTKDTERAGFSVSHGAGRKWARSLCMSRIKNKYDKITIRKNKYRGRVVCRDLYLLFQEAPEAYKNIDVVIQSLAEKNLIKVIATLKPVLTYKG